MAYPKIRPFALPQVSVATASAYTVSISSLGLTLVNDEWILVFVAHSGTADITVSGTGWTEIRDFSTTSGCRMGVYKCKVASGTVADPTFTPASGTQLWQAILMQVPDADAFDCTDTSWQQDNSGAAASLASASGAPGTADCLVVYFGSCKTGSGRDTSMRFLSSEVVGEALDTVVTNTGTGMSICLGVVQQSTAANTQYTMYSGDNASPATNRLGIITLAIKNKTSGKKAADCRAGITKLAWMGSFGAAHEGLLSATWDDPATFCAWDGGTIAGVTASTVAPGEAGMAVAITSSTIQIGKVGCATQLTATMNTSGNIVGGWIPTPSTFDVRGKLLSIEWGVQNLPDEMMGSLGVLLALGDDTAASTGNAIVFQLAPKQAIKPGFLNHTSVISLETATSVETQGTIDATFWTNIKKIGFFWHRAGSSTNSKVLQVRNILLHSNSTMVGGNSAVPLDIRYLDRALNGWGYLDLCGLQGDAVLVKTPIQFGDGTTATYVDTSGTLLNTPQPYSAIMQPLNNITAGALTVGLYTGSSDTINMVSSATASGAQQNFTINASSVAPSSHSFNGEAFKGWNVTWGTNVSVSGAVYSNCATVAFKGADVSSCTISSTTATAGEAACSWDANGVVVTNTTIDVTGSAAGYHIELGTSVTAITLTDVTFTGTPATDKVHVLATTGTVTITISGTTSLVAGDVTSAGATVVISAPVLYQSVTISGATAGSRIQIYDTTSSTELYNGTPTFPYTWTDSAAATATRAIRLRVAYVNGVTAKDYIGVNIGTCGITSGTEAVSYLVNQDDDDTYNTNAINGPLIYATSGITFTDASPDRVNCNISGGGVTYPTIYACFVYWNFTATGIANDFTYIYAPDSANYILSGMKIRNTSATDLTVTGGYGRDATSGLSVDIIDTAGSTGNIFLAPDHVTPYATGSGVTAQDKVDIASQVLSAASASPIHSNVQQINDVTIIGDGSTTPFNV